MAQKTKILLVDDEFFLTETLKARLEFENYEVDVAENGEKACELVQANSYQLVLLDIMMPVMDGFEVARTIREKLKMSKLPIIFLSARAQSIDKKQAQEVGGNDFLSKPFEWAHLKALLSKWIK